MMILVFGFLLIIVQEPVEYIFILFIAAVAIYNRLNDIMLDLDHPRTKYILIPGMIITALVLLARLLIFYPGFSKNLLLAIVGMFTLVFGLFSILLIFNDKDVPSA